MLLASSSALNHQPAVHPHEPGNHLTTSLAGLVVSAVRRLPCRAFGFYLRVRSSLQALGRVLISVAYPIRPFCPHLLNPSVTLASSHGGLFKCGQKLPGNEQ